MDQRMFVWLLVGMGVLFVLGSPANAQGVHATFAGVVRDDGGAPVPGATLTLENVDTGWSRATVSQENGRYELPLVPVGPYRLHVAKDGFATVVLTGLAASVSQNVIVDPVLPRIALEERVEVAASTPLVDVRRVAQGITLTSEVIDGLPISREVLNLQYLAPGTLAARRGFGYDGLVEVATGAQQGQDNVVSVDGANIADPAIGFPSLAPAPNWVEEFQFLTGRYTAEFGGGSGGVVNIISRSGTNEHEVSAYAEFRDDAWDSDDPFAPAGESLPPFGSEDFGVAVGGPIQPDKAHYFAAYDGRRADQTEFIDTAGTLPEFEGPLDAEFQSDNFLAKLDHEPRPGHRLTLSYRFTDASNTDVAFLAPAQIATEESRSDATTSGHQVIFGHAWTLSSVAHNELRLHYSGGDIDLTAHSLDPFEARPSSYTGGHPGLPQRRDAERYQISDTFSRYFTSGPGGHLLKVGGEFQNLPIQLLLTQFQRGAFFFETDTPFDPADPATFPVLQISGFELAEDRTVRQWGLFANDEWTVNNRLFLNLGLRYDIEDGSTNSDVPSPVPFLERPELDTDNVAPRLGATYQLDRGGKSVLRGGYGRYYTRLYLWLFDARTTSELTFTENPDYQGFTNPNGSASSSAVTVLGTDPDIEIPYVDQFSVGTDHQFGRNWALSVDYVGQRGRDEILRVEGNPVDPMTGQRVYPAFGSVPVYTSAGRSEYDGLQLYFRSARESRWGTFGIGYTLSRTRNDHNYFSDYVESVDQLAALEGYSLNDTRHRLVGQGLWHLPLGVRLGGVVMLASAQPFDVNNGLDRNGDGVFDRPPGAERNDERGDDYSRLDLRVTRPFMVRRGAIEPTLEAFNVFDTTNVDPDTIVGNLMSPLYGEGGSSRAPLYQPRQVRLGIRFSYR